MSREVLITSSSGVDLVATLEEPEAPAPGKPMVLMAHGFGSHRNNSTAEVLVPELAADGIASLRFDFSGCGDSGGDFADTTATKQIQDALSCIDYLRRVQGYQRVALFGSSFGGGVSIAAALKSSVPIAAIGLKAPLLNFRRWYDRDLNEPETKDWRISDRKAYFHSKHGEVNVHFSLFRDLAENDTSAAIKSISCPVFIVHGDADELVPIEDSRNTVGQFKNAELLEIPAADHRFKAEATFEHMIAAFADFFRTELLKEH